MAFSPLIGVFMNGDIVVLTSKCFSLAVLSFDFFLDPLPCLSGSVNSFVALESVSSPSFDEWSELASDDFRVTFEFSVSKVPLSGSRFIVTKQRVVDFSTVYS